MRTPRLPVVGWTDAHADLIGLVRFAERRNLVSAHVITFKLASTIWYYVLNPNLLIGFRVTNFWNMTLHSCVDMCQRFGGTCCFHLRKVCPVYGDSISSEKFVTIHQALCRHKTGVLKPTVVTTTALFCSLCSVALTRRFCALPRWSAILAEGETTVPYIRDFSW